VRLKKAEWYEVPEYWPKIEEWVTKALEHGSGGHEPEDIHAALMRRQMDLWLAIEEGVVACAVTQFGFYPRWKYLCVLIIGGTGMKEWLHFDKELTEYALEHGCKAIEGPGRVGWKRPLKEYGYEPLYVIYGKMIQ